MPDISLYVDYYFSLYCRLKTWRCASAWFTQTLSLNSEMRFKNHTDTLQVNCAKDINSHNILEYKILFYLSTIDH